VGVVEIGLVGTTTKTLIKVTLLVAHCFSATSLVKAAVLINAAHIPPLLWDHQ
jgi:hypothetical protein